MTERATVSFEPFLDEVDVHYFPLPRRVRFDRIGVHVPFPSPNPNARVIVVFYDDTGNLYPRNILAQSNPFDVTSTGNKFTAIDLTCDRGVYWLGYLTNDDEWRLGFTRWILRPIGGDTKQGQMAGWYIAATYPNVPNPFPNGGDSMEDVVSVALRLAEYW